MEGVAGFERIPQEGGNFPAAINNGFGDAGRQGNSADAWSDRSRQQTGGNQVEDAVAEEIAEPESLNLNDLGSADGGESSSATTATGRKLPKNSESATVHSTDE